ncbi:MAG: hypothetical protein AAGJ32_00575 [Pseudomonadota bacterium]
MSSDTHADVHADHAHEHGEGCGHVMVRHNDHWDYLHDGHLHHVHGDHVDEHVLEVTDANPADENPIEAALHANHVHGDDDAAHPLVPHGDHFDHIHDGRLHHVHGDHVDDHGPVETRLNG